MCRRIQQNSDSAQLMLCRACDGQLALQLPMNYEHSFLYHISPLDLPTAAIGIDITVQVDSHIAVELRDS
jgi:hypothetical protein